MVILKIAFCFKAKIHQEEIVQTFQPQIIFTS